MNFHPEATNPARLESKTSGRFMRTPLFNRKWCVNETGLSIKKCYDSLADLVRMLRANCVFFINMSTQPKNLSSNLIASAEKAAKEKV